MQSGLLLDVVVREAAVVFQLLTGEDQSLVIWWNTSLILDRRLRVGDGACRLQIQYDGFAGQSFDKDLGTTVEGGAGASGLRTNSRRARLIDLSARGARSTWPVYD